MTEESTSHYESAVHYLFIWTLLQKDFEMERRPNIIFIFIPGSHLSSLMICLVFSATKGTEPGLEFARRRASLQQEKHKYQSQISFRDGEAKDCIQ